jgi:hypothetical protein
MIVWHGLARVLIEVREGFANLSGVNYLAGYW